MKSKEQKKEKKLKNKKELTSEEMQIIKKYKMNLLSCLICVIIFEIYLIVSNIAINSMLIQNFNTYINISYLMCILIAVIMFEISYKKDKINIAIMGIEFIILAINILLIGKFAKESGELYFLQTSYIWPAYYLLKALIIYTLENRRRLKQTIDIADIVKEEKPIKKVAKKRKK